MLRKLNINVSYDPAIPLQGKLSMRKQNLGPHIELYPNIQSIIHSAQTSTNWWTEKQNKSTYGILFRKKNKWKIDTCHNLNEPQKHYAEGMKPDIRVYD